MLRWGAPWHPSRQALDKLFPDRFGVRPLELLHHFADQRAERLLLAGPEILDGLRAFGDDGIQ